MKAPLPVALWGVLGVIAFISSSCYRIGLRLVELPQYELGPEHWCVGLLWLAFMLYAEGYRGFFKQFAPRVVQRGFSMPKVWWAMLLAPVVCMGYICSTPKRKKVSFGVTFAIICVVMVVRQFPQPWRGIVNVGVIAGLLVGVVALCWHLVRALMGKLPGVPDDYPAVYKA